MRNKDLYAARNLQMIAYRTRVKDSSYDDQIPPTFSWCTYSKARQPAILCILPTN